MRGVIKKLHVVWVWFSRSVVSDSCDPVDHQVPLSVESPTQEYSSGLPFPSPGDLPNPGIEPAEPPGKQCVGYIKKNWIWVILKETPSVFLKGGVVSHLKPQAEMQWLEWEVVINLVINLK